MGARIDVSGLQPQALVEVFTFDPTNIGQSSSLILRWHAGTNGVGGPIVWQGVTYNSFPVSADGFEDSAVGKLPRPTLSAANIGGTLGAYLSTMQDGLGAKVTRRRTLAKYLDAANFPAGNPNADPNAHLPDEIFYVARRASTNPIFVQLELAVPFDVAGIQLPRRQVIAGTCQWVYRSPECTYAGPPVQDIDGNATTDPDKDACRKTLTACKARFGNNGILRTSAFPASLLARYSQ